jgi:hypothetical protein
MKKNPQKILTHAELMEKSPEEKLAWLMFGNETKEERGDIKRAMRENDKDALMIYGLRKVVLKEAEKIKKEEENNRK